MVRCQEDVPLQFFFISVVIQNMLPDFVFSITWKGHSTLTPLGKQDLLTLVTILLPLVKSWCRGQFYFTLLETLAFLSP